MDAYTLATIPLSSNISGAFPSLLMYVNGYDRSPNPVKSHINIAALGFSVSSSIMFYAFYCLLEENF